MTVHFIKSIIIRGFRYSSVSNDKQNYSDFSKLWYLLMYYTTQLYLIINTMVISLYR